MAWLLLFGALSLFVGFVLWWWAGTQSYRSQFRTFKEQVAVAQPQGKRVCVVGSGLTGIAAMKACLGEGVDFVCYEADSDVGGFWRYKEQSHFPSVYKSVHIDSDRDMSSYGDFPLSPSDPLFLSNEKLTEYLKKNVKEFNLDSKIHFNCRVLSISPLPLLPHESVCRWKVVTAVTASSASDSSSAAASASAPAAVDEKSSEIIREEQFDGVMVCVGRHGGGAYAPKFPGLDSFSGTVMHSSQFKSAEQAEIAGKRIVVIGVGNSGLDIVTECARKAKSTILVSRSGAHISKMEHGEIAFGSGVMDRLSLLMYERWPWWWRSSIQERLGLKMNPSHKAEQELLNKHGLKPAHRFWQQHLLETGLRDPNNCLHNLLEENLISVKKGVKSVSKKGIVFVGEEENEVEVDTIILATGYRQAVSFLDRSVADLHFTRGDNDVFLYKYMFPMKKEHESLSVLCFLQSLSFLTAELQSRLFVEVLLGRVKLGSEQEKIKEQTDVDVAMRAQFMDRQQLRIQAGMYFSYYEDLAQTLGCCPSVFKLLRERPTALWHAWFTTPQALHYRLVGKGRLEDTESLIEGLYRSHYFGYLPDGQKRPAPNNRGSMKSLMAALFAYVFIFLGLCAAGMCGYDVSGELKKKKLQNLKYSTRDPIKHALNLGEDAADVKLFASKGQVWR